MSDAEKKLTIRELMAARGQCKATFTRLEKYLAADTSAYTKEELQVRKTNLKETYMRYKELSLSLLLLENKAEVDSEEDCEEDSQAENRYLTCLACLEGLLKKKSESCDEPPLRDSSLPMMAKLPSLEIPTFEGKEISTYKPFIEMFKAVVHNDTRITSVQKLCFLRKYLKGEPLQIIDSLPVIGKSYNDALELLNNRYDNPALIVNSHVTSLLDLPSIQRSTAQQIRDLVAKVRQHVTALSNLDQPVQQWDAILSCVILRKIDNLTVRLFHAERDTTTVVTVDELLRFLDKRAAFLEASPVVDRMQSKPKSSVNVSITPVKNLSSKCTMCNQNHKLFKCPVFLDLSSQKRIEFVQKHKLCQICLVSHAQKCRYKFKCTICNSRSHNALIHPTEERPNPETKQVENVNTQQVNLHIAQPISKSVLLPTAKVMVTGAGNKKFVVRALLDCGSQTSFCTTAFAQRLGLPQIDLQKSIATLGNSCHNFTNKGINLQFESLINSFNMNITCSLINKITSKLPQKQVDLSNFIIPKHVDLADKEFYIPGEISLLLASDIFSI